MSSTTSTSGSRISMFGAKSGFVIPKNKLSGSLVPVFQGGKKPGRSEAGNEESNTQVQRRTKWGPDLTQDTAVKKGRALAYQKRVVQITQQLKSGNLEVGDSDDSASPTQNADEKSSDSQIDNEKIKILELERREAIGEILKLNPRYKAPPDYKPLMKEASVQIPVKDYPEYNFVKLIFGLGGDTQKRLEKETEAKIQVYGTRAGARDKVEISPSGGNEIPGAYEELHVKISAETYEKVDTAVSVIELLITSVRGNLVAASASTSGPGDSSSIPSNSKDTVIDPIATEPMGYSNQTSQNQFQYQSPWFPPGSHQTPVHPPLNSSAPILSNPILGQRPPANFSNMPSLFGHQPASGFNPVLQNPSLPSSSQSPMQVLPHPYAPQSQTIGLADPPKTFSAPHPFSGSQVQSLGPHPQMRPSMPLPYQSVSNVPPRPRPFSDLGSSNIGLVTQPRVPNLGPRPVAHQLGNVQPSISLPSSFPAGASLRPMPVSVPGPVPIVAGHSSGSGSVCVPNFTHENPPSSAAPSSLLHGDFTFQPKQPNIITPAPQISPRLNIHIAPPNAPPPTRSILQPPAGNLTSRPVIQTFLRPQQFANHMVQPQMHLSSSFASNSISPAFQNFGPPLLQMRPRNFGLAPQNPNLASPVPLRSVNPMQFQQNYTRPNARLHNQKFNSGTQQVYDPFSPTDA